MKLNLREIIEIPGGSVPFAQELDTALLDFPSVRVRFYGKSNKKFYTLRKVD